MGEIFGYCRVSSREQNEDRQLIAMLEMNVPKKNVFVDKQSGKDFDRPQYKRLMKRLREGDLIYVKSIDRLGRNYAQRKGVKTKSSHKIRKTFASNLNASGVPIDSIREVLGHSNLSTTYNYIFNPLTEKETYDLIAKAL